MSVIEDTRKVMQDFLAPELRGISARLDALEQRFGVVDKRFDAVDHRFDTVDHRFERVDQKLDDVERRAEKRHDEVLGAIARMSDYSSVLERLARLESLQRPAQ
jgi:septation ring formation regulator EzrA